MASLAPTSDDAPPPDDEPITPPRTPAEQLAYLCAHAEVEQADHKRFKMELGEVRRDIAGLRAAFGTLADELQLRGLQTDAAREHLSIHDRQIGQLAAGQAQQQQRLAAEAAERRQNDSQHDIAIEDTQARLIRQSRRVAQVETQVEDLQTEGFTGKKAAKMASPLGALAALEGAAQSLGLPSPSVRAWALLSAHPVAAYAFISGWALGWALSYVRGNLSGAQVAALEQRSPLLLALLDFAHRYAPTVGQAARAVQKRALTPKALPPATPGAPGERPRSTGDLPPPAGPSSAASSPLPDSTPPETPRT